MGARNSKRSVDITTTPKKGEDGAAVTEAGEGKLEKIAEPDLKVTTNGTLHNDIEFADKEETEDREKVVESNKLEIKENGLPEEPSNAVVDECINNAEEAVENVAEQSQVNGEKTPEKEKLDQKIEETTEQKKKKEKKKKWSFRSISFSKKDKSKPSKESNDKNGEVKELPEENVEDKTASPMEEKPNEAQPTESVAVVTNGGGEATPLEQITEKPVAETEVKEDAAKPVVEPSATKLSEPEVKAVEEVKVEDEKEKKEAEPVVKAAEETPKVEEESSKEVRTEEVPPPLPSSNPPSPVTVFAESTKAEAALTTGQVPLEETVESSVVASPTKTEDLGVVSETPVISQKASAVETVVPPPEPVVEKETLPLSPPSPVEPSEVTATEQVPTSAPSNEPKKIVEPIKTKEIPDPFPSIEDLPPAPPSPIPEREKLAYTEPVLESTPNPEPVIDNESVVVESSLPVEPESNPKIAPVEESKKELSEPITSPEIPLVVEDVKSKLESEIKPPAEPLSVPESPKTDLEPSTPPPTPAASSEIPSAEIINPELPSSPLSTDVSEPVVAPADSLPDISTESLPSLPEPLSESLAPMSLPPVDSVPEPIAPSSSEPTLEQQKQQQQQQEEPISDAAAAADSPLVAPLTNGSMNGHSSPSPAVEEEEEEKPTVFETEVSGPTKQIASEAVKESEVSPEAGDNPSETAAVATVEE